MEHLSNETINKYLDNELSETEFITINCHLIACGECKKRLEFEKAILQKLGTETLVSPSDNFSNMLMKEIVKTAKPKFRLSKYLNAQNIYGLFIASVLVLYGISTLFIDTSKQEPNFYTKNIVPFYEKIGDLFKSIFAPLQSLINSMFEKIGAHYLLVGIAFIILFLLFDKYVVERKPKKRTMGTFLV